jgi:hypothetical protein
MDSSTTAAALTLGGVIITALLTVYAALRTGKDRMERNADRRKIEEETTDVILRRTRRELDRVYRLLDSRDEVIKQFHRFIRANREDFERCGISVPDFDVDDDFSVLETAHEVRMVIDKEEEGLLE